MAELDRVHTSTAATSGAAWLLLALALVAPGCSSDDPTDAAAEDRAYALLEQSHELRAAGDFASAEARLEEALELAEPGSEAFGSIRDELSYSVPLARARRALRDGDSEDVAAILAPAREYIRDHPDRFERAREIADLLDESGSGTAPGDTRGAFALLEESHALEAQGDFDGAAERLSRASSLVEPGSAADASIRDELHYHLPMARARWSLTQHDAEGVESSLAAVRGYLEQHPQRFERAREVESLAESARFLRRAIAADTRSQLHNLRMLLTAHFLEVGECPRDVGELTSLIRESAMSVPPSLELRELNRASDSCAARFRNVESGATQDLRWP